jgi:hypothetical protein
MIIKNLRKEIPNGRPTILADVLYEDCDMPGTTVYYQTSPEFEKALTLNPNAFITACALPAMRSGEKRIRMDEEVCPLLIEGLTVAITCLIGWYGDKRILPEFEVKIEQKSSKKRTFRAGSFLSGGIDSLATLRKNRLLYPLTHPASIKDSIFIYGSADIGVNSDKEMHIYERGLKNLQEIANESNLTIIPLYTNVRHVSQHPLDFYVLEYHSCMLASVAHALGQRLDIVTINSAYDVAHLKPFGTHALLDVNYSTYDLRIFHGSAAFSRLERVRTVGNWDFGLQRIRSCLRNDEKLLNCGICWKCLLTQTELLAVGKLAQTRAFPNNDLSPDLFMKHNIKFELERESYMDLLPELDRIGRSDLSSAISNAIERFDKKKFRYRFKESIKYFDDKYFGSNIKKTVRRYKSKESMQ